MRKIKISYDPILLNKTYTPPQKPPKMKIKTRDISDLANYCRYDEDISLFDLSNSEFISKLKSVEYIEVINLQNRSLDDIAYHYFEDEKLWWILALYNDIIDPLNPGNRNIYIPKFSVVESLILSHFDGKGR